MITEVKDFFPQEILDKILFIANNNEYEDINYSVTSGIRKRLDLWSLDISKDIISNLSIKKEILKKKNLIKYQGSSEKN